MTEQAIHVKNLNTFPEFVLPKRAGAGFKTTHIDSILADNSKIGFLEIHAENYMGRGGHPHRILKQLRQHFPLSVHGVGLSIGGEAPLDMEHLMRLKKLVDDYQPAMVSEHLAWSTHDNSYYNDLLPVPYDQETLDRVIRHIHQVQDVLGRQILLENPSSYSAFARSTMSETDFIRAIVSSTGCGLLLDVNNVVVSASNLGTQPEDYLEAFPLDKVQEIHLAGHAEEIGEDGSSILIDAHDRPVDEKVWQLFEHVIWNTGPLPTLIEWDNDVPEWPVLRRECILADRILLRDQLLGARHG